MSYDLLIRKDDMFSASVDAEVILSFFSDMPGINIFSDDFSEFKFLESDLRAEIYLEYVDSSGEVIDWKTSRNLVNSKQTVNAIRVCIPYAHMHNDNRDQVYFLLGKRIAEYLNWQLYDQQTSQYL